MDKEKNKKDFAKQVCSNCHTPEGIGGASKLSACARCGLVVYCSRDCQKAHWKANHRQHCVAKADRIPQKPDAARGGDASRSTVAGEECSICLDSISEASTCTLQCTHVFHAACMEELRKFGMTQACPLCRTPLPPGPAQLNEEAIYRFVMVGRLVERGGASWSALPAKAQSEVDAAIAGWQAAAEQGFAEAQRNLGQLFDFGYGVAQNDKEAAKWYRKAAEQGHAEAQSSLGNFFRMGRGVAQSDKEGVRWIKKAAEQGHEGAQCNLGCLFREGRGVTQSDVEAVHWWKKQPKMGLRRRRTTWGTCIRKELASCRVTWRHYDGLEWQLTKGTRSRRAAWVSIMN